MNSVAGLEPEMESEAVDGRHGSLGGGFARKPAGDQKQSIRMIGIHVPDDFLAPFRPEDRAGRWCIPQPAPTP